MTNFKVIADGTKLQLVFKHTGGEVFGSYSWGFLCHKDTNLVDTLTENSEIPYCRFSPQISGRILLPPSHDEAHWAGTPSSDPQQTRTLSSWPHCCGWIQQWRGGMEGRCRIETWWSQFWLTVVGVMGWEIGSHCCNDETEYQVEQLCYSIL